MNIININRDFDFGLSQSKAVFPVSTRPLMVAGAKDALPVHTHKAVIRTDKDGSNVRPIGIVGSDYKVMKNVDLFGSIEGSIARTMERSLMEGVQVNTEISFDGAWTKREYLFPAFKEALETSDGFKTDVGFRIIGWNSYDGSASAGVASGLIDFYCSNGMILGKMVDLAKRRHTSNFFADHFDKQISDGIGMVQHEVRMLRKMATTQLDPEVGAEILRKHFSKRRAERMIARMEHEASVRGWNVFALHSALTYYSSHNSDEFGIRRTGNDNVAKTLHNREAEVAKMMPEVLRLAA